MWKNFEERHQRIECRFEFLFSTGVPQDQIFTCYLKVTGISEGKESFIHRLIRLMCGTRDDEDEFSQSIVNNSCTVHQLSYFMHQLHASCCYTSKTSNPSCVPSYKQQLLMNVRMNQIASYRMCYELLFTSIRQGLAMLKWSLPF